MLVQRLRIGGREARERLAEAEELGPRRAFTGEPLAPRLPQTAQRQAAGQIGAEHVRIIRKFFDELPDAVDDETHQLCEATLASVAAGNTPAALCAAADRLAGYVNPDGTFSDRDRARRRYQRRRDRPPGAPRSAQEAGVGRQRVSPNPTLRDDRPWRDAEPISRFARSRNRHAGLRQARWTTR